MNLYSNFNVDTVDTAKTRLYSEKFKSELVKWTGNLGHVDTVDTPKPVKTGLIWCPGYCQQRSKAYMLVNFLVND